MRTLTAIAALLLSVCAAAPASAQQNYPNQPVRMIVTTGAGGAPDVIAPWPVLVIHDSGVIGLGGLLGLPGLAARVISGDCPH